MIHFFLQVDFFLPRRIHRIDSMPTHPHPFPLSLLSQAVPTSCAPIALSTDESRHELQETRNVRPLRFVPRSRGTTTTFL